MTIWLKSGAPVDTITLAQQTDLPAKPVDKDGRPVSWLLLTTSPGFKYEGRWIDVDADWINERISVWKRMTSRGYRAPVLAEHKANGERRGDVLDLALYETPTGPALIGAVAWADPATPDKIARGELRYISPQYKTLCDDAGQDLPLALTEVSCASKPHLKNGETHILATESESRMEPQTSPPTEGQPSDADRLAALEKKLDDLIEAFAASQVSAAEKPDDEPEIEPEEETAEPLKMSEGKSPADIKLAELEKRLAASERARARAEFSRNYPVGAVVEITADLEDAFFEMNEAAPKAFAKIKAKAPEKSGKPLAPRRSEIQWGIALAEPAGNPEKGNHSIDLTESTDDDLDRIASERAKGDVDKALDIYLTLQNERAQQLARGNR